MKIAAANWKMNLSAAEALSWLGQANMDAAAWDAVRQAGVLPALFVPHPYIGLCASVLPEGFLLGAQNIHHEEKGAFTGETSALMVQSAGALSVLIGHSERRQYQGEDDALCGKKLALANGRGLFTVYCVGESLDQRQAGNAEAVVRAQVKGALSGLTAADFTLDNFAMAYEPIWAIGTGQEAKPEDAEAMSLAILDELQSLGFPAVPVLYGGSVNAKNAGGFAAMPHVGGGLVGGASLKPVEFLGIAQAFAGITPS